MYLKPLSLMISLAFSLTVWTVPAISANPETPTPVLVGTKGSAIKVDGRIFIGAFNTGSEGPIPNRSLDIPDGKLRFIFNPSGDITIVNRFNTGRASASNFDYFYADLSNLSSRLPDTVLRIGKIKVDVGQETWSDNPVESILITNSVSIVNGYDEGIHLFGPLVKGSVPVRYSIALLNGSKGFEPSASGLAMATKLSVVPANQLFLSTSYFNTGNLVKADGSIASSDLRIAGLQDPPVGATGWNRSLWQIDARYNYGPTGIRPTIVSAPTTRFQAAAAYGQFTDAAVGVADRKGTYWSVEGLYNLTPQIYLASRLSDVALNGSTTARIGGSPVPVNEYRRLSLGAGYRLTPLTHLKMEVTRNNASGGESDPDLHQLAIGLATKF